MEWIRCRPSWSTYNKLTTVMFAFTNGKGHQQGRRESFNTHYCLLPFYLWQYYIGILLTMFGVPQYCNNTHRNITNYYSEKYEQIIYASQLWMNATNSIVHSSILKTLLNHVTCSSCIYDTRAHNSLLMSTTRNFQKVWEKRWTSSVWDGLHYLSVWIIQYLWFTYQQRHAHTRRVG